MIQVLVKNVDNREVLRQFARRVRPESVLNFSSWERELSVLRGERMASDEHYESCREAVLKNMKILDCVGRRHRLEINGHGDLIMTRQAEPDLTLKQILTEANGEGFIYVDGVKPGFKCKVGSMNVFVPEHGPDTVEITDVDGTRWVSPLPDLKFSESS